VKLSLRTLDASLLCFALVVIAAIPVAALRTKTYAIGYELGRLKSEEKLLRQRNTELQSQLASVQRSVRETRLRSGTSQGQAQLNLPQKQNVLRPKHALTESGREKSRGEKNP
jgi:TolA-binding protein